MKKMLYTLGLLLCVLIASPASGGYVSAADENTDKEIETEEKKTETKEGKALQNTDDTVVIDFNGNAKDQFVVITPTGYAIGPSFVSVNNQTYFKPFKGNYIITGERKHTVHIDDIDVLHVKGGTPEDPLNITLKDLTIDLTNMGTYGKADDLTAIGIGTPNQRNADNHDYGSPAVVNLTLEGNNVIKGGPAAAAIGLGRDANLTIQGDGKLTAIGGDSVKSEGGWAGPAIGVDMRGYASDYAGTININSGTILAYGGSQDGADGNPKPNLYRSHMPVAIGGGAGTVNINGGYVEAYGGSYGPGIGTTQYHLASKDSKAKVQIRNATVIAKGGYGAPGIGSAGNDNMKNPYSNHVDVLIENADVSATGGIYGAGIGTGNNGWSVADTITIRNSKIQASAPSGAAIGNGISSSSKNIEIENCTLNVQGGTWSAGIGGGWSSHAGDITIRDSTVTAKGGVYGSAIGSGSKGSSDAIHIINSKVIAIAGEAGAGIGNGFEAVKSPILSVDVASDVSAYAMGYYDMQDKDGKDVEKSVSAIEVDEENSMIESTVLQGRFKTPIADQGDKEFNILHKDGTTTMKMPEKYNSFGRIIAKQKPVKITVDEVYQAGSVAEHKEDVLSKDFEVNQKFSYYWMIQPVKQVSATFESNGGTAVPKQVVDAGETFTEPVKPVKDGFQFEGWYTDKELTKAFDFTTSATTDITLYAKWSERKADNKPDEPSGEIPDQQPDHNNKPDQPSDALPDTPENNNQVSGKPSVDIMDHLKDPNSQNSSFESGKKESADKDKTKTNAVPTGDTTDLVLLWTLLLVTGIGVAIVCKKKHQKQ